MIRRPATAGVSTLLAAIWLTGCAQLTVKRYPDFWQPGQIETVEVVPFDVADGVDPLAGKRVARRLVTALGKNGTYRYISYRRLSETGDPLEPAPEPGDLARAVIIDGRVLQFDLMVSEEIRYIDYGPRYYGGFGYGGRGYRYRRGYGRGGYGYGGVYYESYSYVHVTSRAFVTVMAEMVSAETGQRVKATPVPLVAAVRWEGDRATTPTEGVLDMAIDRAVEQLVQEFAVTEVTLELKPDEALRIADGMGETGDWRDRDSFAITDTQMVVVVDLPPEAHRNSFELRILRHGQDEPVAIRPFTWDRDGAVDGTPFVFSPADLAAVGGAGSYDVAFYAANRKIMARGFKIIEPK